MAIIYKPLALLKAEAIARYEKKETMLHLQLIVKNGRVTPYCQDLISQIKTVHVYYSFNQEWFEMECLGDNDKFCSALLFLQYDSRTF